MRRAFLVVIVLLGSYAASAKSKAWPVLQVPDCKPICERLLFCKAGPWKKVQDCVDACEPTNEDSAKAEKTYDCVGRAQSCGDVRRCGK